MAMNNRLLRPRASGGFTPKSIAGLSAWYDASVSASITVATGVSEWKDLSGNNRHVLQSTGNNQPAYTGTIGGKASVSFDGVNDRLVTSGSVTVVGNGAEWTCFVALSATAGTILSQDDFSSPRPPQFLRFWTGASPNKTVRSFVQNAAGSQTGAISQGVIADSVPFIASARQSATTSDVWVNGASNGTLALTPNTTQFNKPFELGSISASAFFAGLIGEVVMYSRALTASERQSVERYLGKKWGVAVA